MNTRIKLKLAAAKGQVKWAVLLILVGLAVAGAIIAAKAFTQSDDNHVDRKLVVSSQTVEVLAGYYVNRYFSAQVQAQQSLSVASEIAGKVTEIWVDEGDKVVAGDLLFSLDTQIFDQQKAALIAQQESIKADRSLAKKRLKRQQNLNQKSFSSEDTIDALESQIDKLNASLRNLKAQAQDIDIRLNKSKIYAPFDGQIQARYIDKGAIINAGTVALDLIDNNHLEIQAGLPVRIAKDIHVNKPYQFTQNNQQVTARAQAILPKIDPVTQTQGVKFVLASDSELVPGDYIKLVLPSYQEANGFWLANSALIEGERGLWQIFVIDEEGRVNKQSVSIVYPSNPSSFVSANIATGKKVVIKGVHRLANRVAVIEEESTHQTDNTANTTANTQQSEDVLNVGASQ